jgi:hypothetical protein
MTTLPASWLIPYTLNTFHREVPGGGACDCGMWADDLMECIVTTGQAGMIGALDRAEAAVNDNWHCAGRYEASGPGAFRRAHP